MNKIKIICTEEQADDIRCNDNGCIAWGVCTDEDKCETCPYDATHIKFVIKETLKRKPDIERGYVDTESYNKGYFDGWNALFDKLKSED